MAHLDWIRIMSESGLAARFRRVIAGLVLLPGCAEEPPPTPEPAVDCPPEGATGLAVGDVATDVAATDCDGRPVSLHGLCGSPALIANWYGWCPSCEDNAALSRQLADEHPDLAVAVVLDEDPLSDPVDGQLCHDYQALYPSSAQVWMDPDGALEIYGTTDLVLVLDRAGTLVFARNTATEDAIVAAVEGVL